MLLNLQGANPKIHNRNQIYVLYIFGQILLQWFTLATNSDRCQLLHACCNHI